MTKKLVFDRPISLSLRSGQTVKIPNDEVWKIFSAGSMELNGDITSASPETAIFGGGSTISSSGNSATGISGIAFKIVEV